MRIVFLCPRRAGIPERDQIWRRLEERWGTLLPDYPIYVGTHDVGPFNRSAAINLASRKADGDGRWDLAIIIDADVFLPKHQVEAAVARAEETGQVTWAFRRWRQIERQASEAALADDRPGNLLSRDLTGEEDVLDRMVQKTNPISWSCCFVVPRAVFDDMGGFDERFEGWGWEDMAFQSAVCGLHGHQRIEGDLFHMWHPRSTEREIKNGLASREYAMNSALGLRYMSALRVEKRMGDRDVSMTDADVEQDIRNIRNDALRLHEKRANGHDLPDWRSWWPTLRELVDGWKNLQNSVTLVVRTCGGRPECISEAIPSLLENVAGNFVKRVIYDDSADPVYQKWLTDNFGRSGPLGQAGFYVVGPEQHLGYTGSMRSMWSYLRRRCSSRFVFMAEDDFTYDAPINLNDLIEVLYAQPHLRQMALLRHAYYEKEKEAGSILNERPGTYAEAEWNGHRWLEHRNFWTSNPCLFHRALCGTDWPNQENSETVYTRVLNQDRAARMAFWGHGEELITHIGHRRAGDGY